MKESLLQRVPFLKGMEVIDSVRPALESSQIANDILIKGLFSEIKAYGSRHVDEFYQLIQEGNSGVIASGHLSNSDAPVIWRALRELHIRTRDDTFFAVVGKRLLDNPRTAFFTRFIDTIPVWPPTEPTNGGDERRLQVEINNRAQDLSENPLKNGRPLLIFPEGGRSYEGRLSKGNGTSVRYFNLGQKPARDGFSEPTKDTYALPIALVDTNKRYPVGQSLPHLSNRGTAEIHFLEPISVSELTAVYSHLNKSEKQQAIIDHVMLKIATSLLTGSDDESGLPEGNLDYLREAHKKVGVYYLQKLGYTVPQELIDLEAREKEVRKQAKMK